MKILPKLRLSRPSRRHALVGGLVLAVAVPSGAFASGEGRSLLGGERNPRHGGEYTSETEVIANNATYGTRQSNKRDGDGGGAIYGCRSATGHEPCLRANNLKGGRAFEFETVGKEAGQILVHDTSGPPFVTNATGKVANLNADKLDDKDSSDFAAAGDLLFAAVAADGKLGAHRGATASRISNPAGSGYSVTFGRDVSACSPTATPIGTAGDTTLAVGVDPNNKNVIVVDQSATVDAARTSFELNVIC